MRGIEANYRNIRRWSAMAALAVFMLGLAQVQAQRGYRLSGNQIVIESQDHWEQWIRPQHVLDVEDGVIQPHFFRRTYNILAEDQGVFERRMEAPKIRRENRTIRTVGRTPVLDDAGNTKLQELKLSKYLDENFERFPGNASQIVLEDEVFTILDTTLVGTKEVTLALRNERTQVRSSQQFELKSKEQFPEYTYFVRPGISRAGSNVEMAANLLDGDESTYWEPDLADTSDNWWVEVDLGRAVVVEKVVLRFVDEGSGDPFRQFRVLTSPEQRVLEAEDSELNFSVVGGTVAPNVDQRTFVLTAEEGSRFAQSGRDDNWTGRLVETIRILVSDSKRFRGGLVSQAEREALPADERGEIVYYIRDESGFEEPVSVEIYESLDPERQGRKEYYIRERPRLSEVEVWGWGDNLSSGLLGRGGTVDMTGPYKATAAFDGDFVSNFRFLVWSPVKIRGVMTIDLGALIWLDNIRTASFGGIIDGYIVRGSDGGRDASGELKWRVISSAEREDNLNDRFRFISDIYDPPLKVRYLHMRNVSTNPGRRGGYNTGFNLGEMMLFAEGHMAEGTMTSDIIRLPGPRNLGAIRWTPGPEQQPAGTEVEIRTRTGDLLVENVRYLDSSGNEKSLKDWENLLSKYRGPVDTTFAIGSGWSPWSRKYLQSGDLVTSPGLRNLIQVQVKFTTQDRQQAASLSSIEVDLFDPVARSLLGEIWPQQVLAGQRDTFEVYLGSTFIESPITERTPGFDEIRLSGPKEMDLHLVGVRIGTEAELEADQPFQAFERDAAGAWVSASGESLEVLAEEESEVWFRLPSVQQSAPTELMPRLYHRITGEGDEVVVGHDEEVLSEGAYGLLSEEERGQILFFKETVDGRLEVVVDRIAYDELAPEEQGPIRYFRKLLGSGGEFAFDVQGDSLTQASYNALDRSARGVVVGGGRLVQVRVAGTVYLNGTAVQAFTRLADPSAADEGLWQQAEGGETTSLAAGQGLSVGVPVGGKVLDEMVLSPNPFTPNGDGINDELEVSFSLFQVTSARPVRLRVYGLDGQLLWQGEQPVQSGVHALRWPGVDQAGEVVPPGLYICQLHVGADADNSKSTTLSRLVAVAY